MDQLQNRAARRRKGGALLLPNTGGNGLAQTISRDLKTPQLNRSTRVELRDDSLCTPCIWSSTDALHRRPSVAAAMLSALPLVALGFFLAYQVDYSSGVTTCNSTRLNYTDVVRIATLIRDRIYCYSDNTTDEDGNRFHPLIAGCLRLAFHASTDRRYFGCINLADLANNGLYITVNEMENILNIIRTDSYYKPMSRADLWALAGFVSMDIANDMAGDYTLFKYGRCDVCTTSYNTSAIFNLPAANIGPDGALKYFRSTFGFSDNQTVAIMGAHSLGVIRRKDSPVVLGKWLTDPEHFGSDYYADLINSSRQWEQVLYSNAKPSLGVTIWRHGDTKQRAFLNSDIGMYKNMTVPDLTTGLSSCLYDSCPLTRLARNVEFYANPNNTQKWMYDFQRAFVQMVEFPSPTPLYRPT